MNHADLPTQVEDSLSKWDVALARILADDDVNAKERAELRSMRREVRAMMLPVGQMRLVYRVIRRATVCGVENLFDKHIRSDMEDLQRRQALVNGKVALRVRIVKRPKRVDDRLGKPTKGF